jgi:hypothetical protein
MTTRTRKWLHAALVALASALVDVGAQLASGALNASRAVIVGAVMGVFARAAGAALAAGALYGADSDTH